jgi:hypothetical protein
MLVKVRDAASVLAQTALRSHISESTRHYISSCAHGCEISYQYKYAALLYGVHKVLGTKLRD